MAGLSFEFLVVEEGKCWQRRGRVQRIVGVRPEFFHRAEALQVPEQVMRELAALFKIANPDFNFYGPTEFTGQSLRTLTTALESGWKSRANQVDLQLTDAVRALANQARLALDEGKALLALGI